MHLNYRIFELKKENRKDKLFSLKPDSLFLCLCFVFLKSEIATSFSNCEKCNVSFRTYEVLAHGTYPGRPSQPNKKHGKHQIFLQNIQIFSI